MERPIHVLNLWIFVFSLYFPDLDAYPFGEDVGITLTKKVNNPKNLIN